MVEITGIALFLFIAILVFVMLTAVHDYIHGRNRGKQLSVIMLCIFIIALVLNIFKQFSKIMGGM